MRTLELIFVPSGAAELVGSGDRVYWASDDDDEFYEKNKNELLEADKDAASILDYLVNEQIITSEEADAIEIYSESEAAESENDTDNVPIDNIIDGEFRERD